MGKHNGHKKVMILTENRHNDYGCLMAMVDKKSANIISKFAHKIISSDILYIDPNDDSYGFDDEPHCTIKYGFIPDLTKKDVDYILKGVKPFNITLTALSQFNSELYDVIKFDVEKSDVLKRLRKKADEFKNEDEYPNYKPHMTLAYTKPKTFKLTRKNLNIVLPITRFKYSGMNNEKFYINL
jgi:2'-5' RNA ligase superfamily